MNLAPIVVFTYNRLKHTQETIESLKKNIYASESELYIFSDGGKDQVSWEKVQQVREYLKTIGGFKKVIIVENNSNKGLAKSIIFGVNQMFEQYNRIIVLEDDILTSKYFLKYMNESLDMYQEDEDVACISAYTYPIEDLESTFFIRGVDCQGWATWKRGWDLFEEDGQKLLDEIKFENLEKEFDFNDAYPYTQMLQDQIEGKNSSWAVRWYASAFLKNKLCLYPAKALVHNIGFDSSGTHCENNSKSILITQIHNNPIQLKKIEVKENPKMRKKFEEFFLKLLRKKKGNFLFSIEKNRNKRTINLLGFIKIKYNIRKKHFKQKYGFFGDYKSFKEAEQLCEGYSSSKILEKTLDSVLKVKNGEAVFERDSFIFDKVQYSWTLLACLFKVAAKNGNKLKVLDFGGALGSHYFQNKEFLQPTNIESWTVVEQEHYVKAGNEKIADGILNFKNSIDDINSADVLLLSSVLQYLKDPYEWLEKFIDKGLEYIIIDRTAFSLENRDRLTLQSVPPIIYEAKYPAWFLDERKFLSYFSGKYQLITDFEVTFDKVLEIPSIYKGYFFKRINK